MAKIIFTKDASTHTFTVARVYPKYDPVRVNVVKGYSDGGQLYAYDKGIEEQFFNLVFVRLSEADHIALLAWFRTIAIGAKNTFTFTDEDSVEHTVRWIDDQYPLRLDEAQSAIYSGTIKLREEV